MLNLKKVAVTGGLACGKSTVCHILEKLGATIVSADKIVHQHLHPDSSIGKQVINLIGADCVENGTINRTIIAKRVFNNPELLKSLEEILHPAVKAEIDKQYALTKQEGSSPLFVAEVPLLFESETDFHFDATIAVTADDNLCKKRFSNYSTKASSDWEKRMEQQMDPREKALKADYVIQNNGPLTETEEQVKQIFNQLTN